jgi:hypothetical protein
LTSLEIDSDASSLSVLPDDSIVGLIGTVDVIVAPYTDIKVATYSKDSPPNANIADTSISSAEKAKSTGTKGNP